MRAVKESITYCNKEQTEFQRTKGNINLFILDVGTLRLIKKGKVGGKIKK